MKIKYLLAVILALFVLFLVIQIFPIIKLHFVGESLSTHSSFLVTQSTGMCIAASQLSVSSNNANIKNPNIIKITNASHLGKDKHFIDNIYDSVKLLDYIWSKPINDEEIIRITFEKDLTRENDITIFPIVISGKPEIKVYENQKDKIIAEFINIKNNEYNKVYLSLLEGTQDTFDLKIINGKVQFDHIIDPQSLLYIESESCLPSNKCTVTNSGNLLGAPDGTQANAPTTAGGWAQSAITWEYTIENTSASGTFNYANITFYNLKSASNVDDSLVLEYQNGNGTWNILRCFESDTDNCASSFAYPTSETNITFAASMITSFEEVNSTQIRMRGATQDGSPNNWEMYIDSILLNVTYTTIDNPPAINMTYPQNISYSVNVSELNYTVSDANLQTCWYSLNNGVANTTITCGNNATGLTSTEGSNTWTVWANDTSNNINQSVVTFSKDTANDIFSVNISDLITITETRTSIGGLFKNPSEGITLTPEQAKTGSLFKNPSQQFSLNEVGSRLSKLFRINADTININTITNRFTGIFKIPSDLLNFNILTNRNLGAGRTSSQVISINVITGRFIGIFKIPSDLLNFNILTGRSYGTSRITSQAININAITGRFIGIFRINADTINVNGITSRFIGIFRIPALQITLNVVGGTLDIISKFLIDIAQQINIDAMTNRLIGIFRLPSDLLNFNILTGRSYGTSRITTQTININEITNRFAGIFRINTDIINVNGITSRFTGIFRINADTININAVTSRFIGIFRINTDIININSVTSRFIGIFRITTDTFNINGVTSRFTGLFRASFQQITLNNFVTRLSTGIEQYIVNIAQQINISHMVNRVTSLFRSLSNGLQFLINLITGYQQAAVTTPYPGGGNGGGGSGSRSLIITGKSTSEKPILEITPEKFSVSLKQGTNTKRTLKIKNLGSNTEKIKLESSHLNKFIRISDIEFDLKGGESKDIDIEFIVSEEIKPDLYLGKITIKTEDIEKEVLVAIDVSSKKSLLDVKAEISELHSEIYPGDKLIVKIQLFNFGTKERVDVKVRYIIRRVDSANLDSSANTLNETPKSPTGFLTLNTITGRVAEILGIAPKDEIIILEEETVAVETQTTFLKELRIPSNLKSGTHLLNIKAVYSDGSEEIVTTSSAWFIVQGKSLTSLLIFIIAISIILTAVIILIIEFIIRKNKRYNQFKDKVAIDDLLQYIR